MFKFVSNSVYLQVIGPLHSTLFIWGQFKSKFAHGSLSFQVFCQSAIDGAQNDHASKVHAILANKAGLVAWVSRIAAASRFSGDKTKSRLVRN